MAELRFAPAVCFLLCLAFLLPLRSDAVVNKKHVAALQALKQAWQATSLAWQGDPCTGSWFGITCDDTDTKVLQLVLPHQALNGNLPAAIGDLTDLTTLDLALNDKLNGAIPPEIGNLGNLQILALEYCSFSGKIPPEIGKLSALTFLSLKQNSLTGSIPSTVGKLINVDWFDVSDNRLSGSLPVSITGGGLDTDKCTAFNCEQEAAYAGAESTTASEKSESYMRLSWALVHSRQPADIQRGIAMLEASLANRGGPLQTREILYLLAVGHFRAGDYSRARRFIDEALEMSPDFRQGATLRKMIEDKIAKDGLIGIGLAAAAIGIVASGVAAIVARKK